METRRQFQPEITKADPSVVCLTCCRPLGGYSLGREQQDRYGRKLRTYAGWCCECNLGIEAVQFARDGTWFIHKYRHFQPPADKVLPLPDEWQLVNELPEGAPVVLGPGGDYDEPVEIDTKGIFNALELIRKGMSALVTAITQRRAE